MKLLLLTESNTKLQSWSITLSKNNHVTLHMDCVRAEICSIPRSFSHHAPHASEADNLFHAFPSNSGQLFHGGFCCADGLTPVQLPASAWNTTWIHIMAKNIGMGCCVFRLLPILWLNVRLCYVSIMWYLWLWLYNMFMLTCCFSGYYLKCLYLKSHRATKWSNTIEPLQCFILLW